MSGTDARMQAAPASQCSACGAEDTGRRFCVHCGIQLRTLEAPRLAIAPAPVAQAAAPLPAGVRSPERALPRVAPRASTAVVHWVGVHGGAGERTMTQIFPAGRTVAAGHGWPIADDIAGVEPLRVPVILVARSHMRGLRAAQDALREWASGAIPVVLLGLVVIADAPGALPKPLRTMRQLVSGGAPKTWHVPFVEAVRLGHPINLDTLDPALNRFRREVEPSLPTL